MAEITATNTDWAVVNAVKTALATATIDSEAVFQSVTATTGQGQARQCQFTASPAAIVRYLTTDEQTCPEQIVRSLVSVELILAVKVDSPASDESDRLEEILRLVGAAKSAILAAPPPEACNWGQGAAFSAGIEFGHGQIDTAEHDPWAVALLPVNFTLVPDDRTARGVMSIPTFNSVALVSRAPRDTPASPQVRLRVETMPGADGQFVQLHGTGGREIVVRGVLEATGQTPAGAHQALKTALRARQGLADGTTVSAYVGTDEVTYANCLLKTYEASGQVQISPAEEDYQALVFVEARIEQLTP